MGRHWAKRCTVHSEPNLQDSCSYKSSKVRCDYRVQKRCNNIRYKCYMNVLHTVKPGGIRQCILTEQAEKACAVFSHLGLAGGGPITAFPSTPWPLPTLPPPFCGRLASLPLLLVASCCLALRSADWFSGTGAAVLAEAAAVVR